MKRKKPTRTWTRWVNVYKGRMWTYAFHSKREADAHAVRPCETVRVQITELSTPKETK